MGDENSDFIRKLELIGSRVGNTPAVPLAMPGIELFAKLEYYNFIGSIKDRAAYAILKAGIARGEIQRDTTVIEASSGNFALSTAAICHFLGIPFIAVIDPGVNRVYEQLIQYFSSRIIKVDQKDKNDGYLLTKLEAVQQFLSANPNAFWTNQYENEGNFLAHYEGTALEICDAFDELDYIFLAVASGGTIAGISNRVKERYPDIKVIAVDAVGSVIFGTPPQPRYIPGMGSGMVPPLVKRALIDDIVHVNEPDTIEGCRELFSRHALFVGGSSGTVYQAVKTYFQGKTFSRPPKVLFICPDRGTGYADNIYDESWLEDFYTKHRHRVG